MSNASKALLQYEGGQQAYSMSALTDSGDGASFTSSAALFSMFTGAEPDVRPDGLLTGGTVSIAVSGTNELIDVSALTAYIGGILKTVGAASDEVAVRGTTKDFSISSVTVTSAGAVAIITGTEGDAFSEVRGAAGAPAYIPTTSVEIAQIRMSSQVAGAILSTEIFSVAGTHTERSDTPSWSQDNDNAQITMASVLPSSHTGDVPKGVFASYAEPIFVDVDKSSDFVPPENSHSVSSTQIYGGTLGSSSESLNQGSFTAYLNNGVSDPLIGLKNETLWFKFFPNRNNVPHILSQGKLGISRTFPASDSVAAACTISAETEAVDIAN